MKIAKKASRDSISANCSSAVGPPRLAVSQDASRPDIDDTPSASALWVERLYHTPVSDLKTGALERWVAGSLDHECAKNHEHMNHEAPERDRLSS